MAAAEATARLLTGHGHDARAVAGMADLLALAASFEPHLVILHIDPPTHSALEAARVLRHSKRGTARIMLIALIASTDSTASSDGLDVAQAHAAGFDLVVPAPVDDDFMCQLVQGSVDTHSADAHPGDPLDRVLNGG